jgi:hypothetical protein
MTLSRTTMHIVGEHLLTLRLGHTALYDPAMPMLSTRRCVVLLGIAIVACHPTVGMPRGAPAPQLVRGIAYVIDTTVLTRNTYDPSRPDPAAGSYRAFQTFSARVTYARGHGRLDVLRVRPGAPVRVDNAALTTPTARPGDYYLFDSTGFVLVRPATRTFSRATITHDAYGGYEDREGWPEFFEFQPPHLDTLATPAPSVQTPVPLNVYWHTDSGRTGFARGRTAIDAVPLRELNVTRWFGATRWRAQVAESGRPIPGELTVTVAIPFRPPDKKGVPRSYVLKQAFANPAVVDVDMSSFVLPTGFTQVPWPEGTRDANSEGRLRDASAHGHRAQTELGDRP